MRIANVLLITWLAALVGAVAVAPAPRAGDETHSPQPSPTSCPTVTVSCYDIGMYGEPIKFTANISGGDPAVTPKFKWTVPNYRILSGEDTFSITVEPPAQGGTVVATVEVDGYDRSCLMKADCTTSIIYDPGPDKLDEYGNVSFKDEKARLDHFAAALKNDPTAQGYLVCYGGRRSHAGEAQRRCERAMKYTSTHFGGIDPLRLVTVDGGFREEPAVELWIVPSGFIPPSATPTVDPQEVRPPASPRKARRRPR